jgi:predicted membrane-bound spermidine synthase
MNRYLYFTVFSSGLVTLALELSASRLLGSVFGTSNLVWASIIGLILIYLTMGYFVGGLWADRSPKFSTLFTIIAWGAFIAGLIPVVARPVLWAAANAFDQLQVGVLLGAFTAVLILFSIPVTLLGTVSPFAIRLAMTDSRHAGSIAGRLYGISTLGSFIGTFLPELVMIPLFGTARTFLGFSLFLVCVALVGLVFSGSFRRALLYAWMPLILFLLILLGINIPIKKTPGLIYETESTYNYIQVLENDGYRVLRLNEGQGVHSVWHPNRIIFHGPWDQFLVAPYFNPPPYTPDKVTSLAIVGLAAGTTANQATAVYGPIPIDGYEIDPEIIRVGQEYFNMNEPNLNPIPQDGRWGLRTSSRRYSLIVVDAYRPPYIPWHLTTVEFFQIVYDHLLDDGSLAINVGHSPTDRSLIEGLYATISQVFPSVYVVDIPDTFNSIIYATVQPTDMANLYANYDLLDQSGAVHPLIIAALQRVVMYQQPAPDSFMVFTDDRAPIEWITNQMVLQFVLSDGVEQMP